MHTLGHLWVKNCIGPIEKRIEALNVPASIKITLRVIAATMPAFTGSLVFGRLAPVFILSSVALLYLAAKPVQEGIFELSPKARHWHISMPLQVFMLTWALILALTGQPGQIGRAVGAMTMAVAVAIWPVYMSRKAYEKKRRKIAFASAYSLVAAIVIFQQLIIIGGAL